MRRLLALDLVAGDAAALKVRPLLDERDGPRSPAMGPARGTS